MYKYLYMTKSSTVLLERDVIENLKKAKEYPRQTYNELLRKMTNMYVKAKKQKSQYDEFLHRIQQQKMKELWDNKKDEEWERA